MRAAPSSVRGLSTRLIALCAVAYLGASPASAGERTILINIAKDGAITIKGRQVDRADVPLRLKELHATSPAAALNFRVAADLPYRDIGGLIYAAQNAGFSKADVVVAPPAGQR